MAEATNKRPGEMPRYRLTEKAYLNERLYDPEEMPFDQTAEPDESGSLPRRPLIVSFAGVPAYYMEPVNEAARAMVAKHQDRMTAFNPIDALTIVGEEPQTAKA